MRALGLAVVVAPEAAAPPWQYAGIAA